MTEIRDFKGVWIPKDVWLNSDLTMLEKVIFTEISSLDNENHCTAGNEYFATFCGCSLSKVSKAIKRLKDLEMVEELEFDGRHRKLCIVKSTRQTGKKYQADSYKVPANNIESSIGNNIANSKELAQNSESSKPREKKESMYSKCVLLIEAFTENQQLRIDLTDYLKLLLEMKRNGYYFYTNMWKGILRKLGDLTSDTEEQCKIVRQSIERGYKSVFPLINTKKNMPRVFAEQGVQSTAHTEAELKQLEQLDEERKRNGLRTKF